MLKINGLTKSYGNKKAVDNLSLHIKPGEICGFIGHNGAGKTTTIKACTGLLRFDSGEILIDGISITKNPLECKRKLAYIPDNPDMYEYMTGIKYLNFIADVYSLPKDMREKGIKEYGEELGLINDYAQPIRAYSHGMKQKLAIIAALIHEPKLIMMDEPFVGLDPSASHKVKQLMQKKCKEGSAIFFSTHVLEVAEKLCNNVAIIQNGKLVAYGETENVTQNTSLEAVFLELVANDD